MMHERIQTDLDLHDPERGFSFTTRPGGVELTFIDWRNRNVVFRFHDVYLFHHQLGEGYRNLPEGEVIELHDSDAVGELRENGTLSRDEAVRHIVMSTNEGEWCEIVAGRFDLQVTG